MAIFPGGACLFLLREDEAGGLEVRTAIGVNQEFFLGANSTDTGCTSRRVLDTRQSYFGNYDNDDLMIMSSPYVPWTPLNTAIIVPIVHQGQPLGTVNLYNTSSDAFTSHDKQLLEMIAERAAMALYNGMLFDRTRSEAFTDSLTGLYNIRFMTKQVGEKCRIGVSRRDCALEGCCQNRRRPGTGAALTSFGDPACDTLARPRRDVRPALHGPR